MSARALRGTMIVLGIAGVGLASYLTYVHYAGIQPLCTAGNSCLKVQTSIYAEIDGVPVALMGLIGYILILALLVIPQNENTRLGGVILTAGGFAFSLYLTYRELFSIHAVCEECATSAVLMTILMILSIWRFLRGAPPDGPIAEGDGNGRPEAEGKDPSLLSVSG